MAFSAPSIRHLCWIIFTADLVLSFKASEFLKKNAKGAGSYFSLTPTASAECLIDCIHSAQAQPIVIPDMVYQGAYYSDSSKQMFGAVCNAYAQHKQCIIKCNEGSAAAQALEALKPLEYLCVKHFKEFSESYECLTEARRKVAIECTPKCGKLQDLIQYIQLQQQAVGNKSAQFQIAMQTFCTYSACQKDCHSPVLESSCGARATFLLDQLNSYSMAEFVQQIQQFGINEQTLEKCAQVASGGRVLSPKLTTNKVGSLWNSVNLNVRPLGSQGGLMVAARAEIFNPHKRPSYKDSSHFETQQIINKLDNLLKPRPPTEAESPFRTDIMIGVTCTIVIVGLICIFGLIKILNRNSKNDINNAVIKDMKHQNMIISPPDDILIKKCDLDKY